MQNKWDQISFCCYSHEVLEDYWKDWKRSQPDTTVQFKFSDEKIKGVLPLQDDTGWQAALAGTGTVRGLDWYDGIVMWLSCDLSFRCAAVQLSMIVFQMAVRDWNLQWSCISTLRLFTVLWFTVIIVIAIKWERLRRHITWLLKELMRDNFPFHSRFMNYRVSQQCNTDHPQHFDCCWNHSEWAQFGCSESICVYILL